LHRRYKRSTIIIVDSGNLDALWDLVCGSFTGDGCYSVVSTTKELLDDVRAYLTASLVRGISRHPDMIAKPGDAYADYSNVLNVIFIACWLILCVLYSHGVALGYPSLKRE
jgi:hypothetical protein